MGTITGSRGAFEQPLHFGRAESGNFSQRSFNGTKREITALANAFAQVPGIAWEVTESFGMSRLDIHIPWGPVGVDPTTDKIENWELFSLVSEVDMLAAKTFTGVTDKLSDKQVTKIRTLLQNSPDPTDPDYPVQADFVLDSGTDGLKAYVVWLRMKKGITSYLTETPSLRHTLTTSLRYSVPASLLNVRRICSTDYLIRKENLPAGLIVPPDSANDPASGDSLMVYGWYKHFPTVQQVALMKWQIIQEFVYGIWDTTFYGDLVT